jgi:hypothetical protein
MSLRALTQFEVSLVQELVILGTTNNWEYATLLTSADGPSINGLQTSMRTDAVALTPEFLHSLPQPRSIIIHHNHLSQESLSDADWLGLNNFFLETFAHCEDGTIYWGQVINNFDVSRVLENYGLHECNASTILCNIMMGKGFYHNTLTDEATFFRKEIINRAMRIAGFVAYEFSWGVKSCAPSTNGPWIQCSVGSLGLKINDFIDLAAAELAKSL